MHALSDEQQLERLEKKVDDGFAEMRAEFRSIRGEMGSLREEMGAMMRAVFWGFVGLFGTMIFGFAGIILAMLAHV
jgi:hypothetical protein